jgi:hypothetical protein
MEHGIFDSTAEMCSPVMSCHSRYNTLYNRLQSTGVSEIYRSHLQDRIRVYIPLKLGLTFQLTARRFVTTAASASHHGISQ